MEEGRLTDSFGRHVDFKNVILIMTSNIGADLIRNQAGFGFGKRTAEANYEKMKEMLQKEVDRHFRPEFINRLDDVIVFHALTKDDLTTIVEYELNKVFKRLTKQGYRLDVATAAKDFLIEKGYSTEFGARPLRRAIERYIEDPLSENILRGQFKGKNVIKISIQDEESLRFEGLSEEKPKAEAAPAPVTTGPAKETPQPEGT
jgi:ATP-dependent Clp protease ATP-binding subunit ClpC